MCVWEGGWRVNAEMNGMKDRVSVQVCTPCLSQVTAPQPILYDPVPSHLINVISLHWLLSGHIVYLAACPVRRAFRPSEGQLCLSPFSSK